MQFILRGLSPFYQPTKLSLRTSPTDDHAQCFISCLPPPGRGRVFYFEHNASSSPVVVSRFHPYPLQSAEHGGASRKNKKNDTHYEAEGFVLRSGSFWPGDRHKHADTHMHSFLYHRDNKGSVGEVLFVLRSLSGWMEGRRPLNRSVVAITSETDFRRLFLFLGWRRRWWCSREAACTMLCYSWSLLSSL